MEEGMNYAIQQCSDGNFVTVQEFPKTVEDNLRKAIVRWHQVCAALWNDLTVIRAVCRIVDENLNVVMGKTEEIGHDAPVTPEEEPEPTEET